MNARAAAEGAGFGGTVYYKYIPFDVEEVYKMMGLMLVNGVCPRPGVIMWFKKHPIFWKRVHFNCFEQAGEGRRAGNPRSLSLEALPAVHVHV
jgi:hypothetical protein